LPISSPSAPSGRLSLPDGAEGVGWGSPTTERPSLSAQQAAKPQVICHSPDRDMDKGELNSACNLETAWWFLTANTWIRDSSDMLFHVDRIHLSYSP
jgi:hypothetical protein